MGTVEVVTKDRMLAIEAASVVSGSVDAGGHLILQRFDETLIDAGVVKGQDGEDATALLGVSNVSSVTLALAGLGTPEDPWDLSASLSGVSVADWNLAIDVGFYWANGAANAPHSGTLVGSVVRSPTGYLIQSLSPTNLKVLFQFRRVFDGTTWSPWGFEPGSVVFHATMVDEPYANNNFLSMGHPDRAWANLFDPFGVLHPTDTWKILPKWAGWYEVTAQTAWAASSTGLRAIHLKRNDVLVGGAGPQIDSNINANGHFQMQGDVAIDVAGTDYLSIDARQQSGGTLNLSSVVKVRYLMPLY